VTVDARRQNVADEIARADGAFAAATALVPLGLHADAISRTYSGVFPSSFNRTLSALQRARELADYDAAVVFGEADAQTELDDERSFAAAARGWLEREGWVG
jgi:hypothetical protein